MASKHLDSATLSAQEKKAGDQLPPQFAKKKKKKGAAAKATGAKGAPPAFLGKMK